MLAYGEDWDRVDPILFCEGEVTQARLGAEALRLRRRIEAPVGGSALHRHRHGGESGQHGHPQASLYHFNLGFPALADGTVVEALDRTLLGPLRVPDAALPSESVSYPVGTDDLAACTVSTPQPDGSLLQVRFAWSADSLPHLQLWHNLQPRVCVLSVEPCTSARRDGGLSDQERILEPGETRRYVMQVNVASNVEPAGT